MTAGRDDDALAWGGDDDPTLDVVAVRGTEPDPADEVPAVLPEGFVAVGKGSERVGAPGAPGAPAAKATVTTPAAPTEGEAPAARAPMGNAALVTVGVLGGIYALYAIGWLIGGLRLQATAEYLIAAVAFQFGLWLAVAAPILWFLTTYVLTRGSRTWVRIVWLIAGAALLIPWPFIMTGAIGR